MPRRWLPIICAAVVAVGCGSPSGSGKASPTATATDTPTAPPPRRRRRRRPRRRRSTAPTCSSSRRPRSPAATRRRSRAPAATRSCARCSTTPRRCGTGQFQAAGLTYHPARLTIFSQQVHLGDVAQAYVVAHELGHHVQTLLIEVADAVVATREPNGKVKLHQTVNPAGTGAAGGALWGGLIGGAVGAASGAVTDLGIEDNFIKELGQSLPEGGAALFVLVRQVTPTRSSRASASTAARCCRPP